MQSVRQASLLGMSLTQRHTEFCWTQEKSASPGTSSLMRLHQQLLFKTGAGMWKKRSRPAQQSTQRSFKLTLRALTTVLPTPQTHMMKKRIHQKHRQQLHSQLQLSPLQQLQVKSQLQQFPSQKLQVRSQSGHATLHGSAGHPLRSTKLKQPKQLSLRSLRPLQKL